jgi:NADH-quinone oxidoreductase subunit M
MTGMGGYLLDAVLFLPVAGALMLMALPAREKGALRGFALAVSVTTFLLSLVVWRRFDPADAGFQLVTDVAWVESVGIRFHVALDGISLWLVLLTTFISPIAIASTFRAVDDRVKEFMAAFLVMESAMLGAFVARDLFLFFVFWEAMLIPMYLLIGVWGSQRRIYATVKFFLFTMAGSVLMLIAILYVYLKAGATSFEPEALHTAALSGGEQKWLFAAFALAFAIKVPMFPLHTWLPDAHTEAPTAGSVILAAVLLKLGTYGMLRFALPLFPAATVAFAPLFAVLSVVAILYGAFMALAQHDVKKLIAYSSVSHLGYVTLGLVMGTEASVQGALLQMVNHGLSTGALFLGVGVLYERRHTRLIAEYGGVAARMPVFATVFMLATLSSIGLPGLNGFVGEFLVLLGTYRSGEVAGAPWYAALGAAGVIFGAVYMLWTYQRVMFGPLKNPANKELEDLTPREVAYFLPLVAMMVVIGVYPKLLLDPMAPSVRAFVARYHDDRVTAAARAEVEDLAVPVTPGVGTAGPKRPAPPKGAAGTPAAPGAMHPAAPGMPRTAAPLRAPGAPVPGAAGAPPGVTTPAPATAGGLR